MLCLMCSWYTCFSKQGKQRKGLAMTVKELQGVLFGVCEWRVYDFYGNYIETHITHAYDVRFKLGYSNYKIRKIESGARTDGYTIVEIWPPKN